MGQNVMRAGLVVCFLVGGVAQASPWDATFPPASVASQLVGEPTVVLVAPMGTGAESAATALVDSVRASGRVRLVIDGRSLNRANVASISTMNDRDLAHRAHGVGADWTLAVRVFAGPPETAVIELLDGKGTAVHAFTALAGTPLAPRVATVGEGVSETAQGRVADLARQSRGPVPANEDTEDDVPQGMPPQPPPPPMYPNFPPQPQRMDDPRELQYRQRAIFVGMRASLDPYGYFRYSSGIHIGERLADEEELYGALERQDLAEQWRSRHRTRTALMGTGGALLGVGLVVLLVGAVLPLGCYDNPGCGYGSTEYGLMGGGGAAAGLGLAMLIGGGVIHAQPISDGELSHLIRGYNDKIRREIGLPVAVSPYASPTGGGLRLGGSF